MKKRKPARSAKTKLLRIRQVCERSLVLEHRKDFGYHDDGGTRYKSRFDTRVFNHVSGDHARAVLAGIVNRRQKWVVMVWADYITDQRREETIIPSEAVMVEELNPVIKCVIDEMMNHAVTDYGWTVRLYDKQRDAA